MTAYEIKERNRAKLLCSKLTDDELDTFYKNPGVAKFVHAFSEGKTIFKGVSNEWFKVESVDFFSTPPVDKHPWRIYEEVGTNNIED